jgi:hypothetical protein
MNNKPCSLISTRASKVVKTIIPDRLVFSYPISLTKGENQKKKIGFQKKKFDDVFTRKQMTAWNFIWY